MSFSIPAAYRGVEHAFELAFGGALNPLKHLGALAFLLFRLPALSGAVLYAAGLPLLVALAHNMLAAMLLAVLLALAGRGGRGPSAARSPSQEK